MDKSGVYGVSSVTLADVVAGSFPTTWNGFSFKAIVKDSLQYNDQAAGTTDIEVEDSDDPYAVLESSAAQKGFTLNTYDMSEDAFIGLLGYTKDNATKWVTEPIEDVVLEKAVQIVTKKMGDFPSKTFQWARMKLQVTKAGTIGKSGFPNLTITFRQLANFDANGKEQPGSRFGITSEVNPTAVAPASGD
jgi:hypothetical protein